MCNTNWIAVILHQALADLGKFYYIRTMLIMLNKTKHY